MRILLVDEQALFLDSLRGALSDVGGVQYVATTTDGRAAAQLYESERCNICLVDVGSPRLEWERVFEGIQSVDPRAMLVALTARFDESLVIDVVLRGAKGYLLKHSRVVELTWALQRIHMGQEVYAPEVAGILTRRLRDLLLSGESTAAGTGGGAPWGGGPEVAKLSLREREILMYVADGISNREIAKIVHVTEGTVKNHVSSILRKLKLSQRSELVAFAWSRGLKGRAVVESERRAQPGL